MLATCAARRSERRQPAATRLARALACALTLCLAGGAERAALSVAQPRAASVWHQGGLGVVEWAWGAAAAAEAPRWRVELAASDGGATAVVSACAPASGRVAWHVPELGPEQRGRFVVRFTRLDPACEPLRPAAAVESASLEVRPPRLRLLEPAAEAADGALRWFRAGEVLRVAWRADLASLPHQHQHQPQHLHLHYQYPRRRAVADSHVVHVFLRAPTGASWRLASAPARSGQAELAIPRDAPTSGRYQVHLELVAAQQHDRHEQLAQHHNHDVHLHATSARFGIAGPRVVLSPPAGGAAKALRPSDRLELQWSVLDPSGATSTEDARLLGNIELVLVAEAPQVDGEARGHGAAATEGWLMLTVAAARGRATWRVPGVARWWAPGRYRIAAKCALARGSHAGGGLLGRSEEPLWVGGFQAVVLRPPPLSHFAGWGAVPALRAPLEIRIAVRNPHRAVRSVVVRVVQLAGRVAGDAEAEADASGAAGRGEVASWVVAGNLSLANAAPDGAVLSLLWRGPPGRGPPPGSPLQLRVEPLAVAEATADEDDEQDAAELAAEASAAAAAAVAASAAAAEAEPELGLQPTPAPSSTASGGRTVGSKGRGQARPLLEQQQSQLGRRHHHHHHHGHREEAWRRRSVALSSPFLLAPDVGPQRPGALPEDFAAALTFAAGLEPFRAWRDRGETVRLPRLAGGPPPLPDSEQAAAEARVAELWLSESGPGPGSSRHKLPRGPGAEWQVEAPAELANRFVLLSAQVADEQLRDAADVKPDSEAETDKGEAEAEAGRSVDKQEPGPRRAPAPRLVGVAGPVWLAATHLSPRLLEPPSGAALAQGDIVHVAVLVPAAADGREAQGLLVVVRRDGDEDWIVVPVTADQADHNGAAGAVESPGDPGASAGAAPLKLLRGTWAVPCDAQSGRYDVALRRDAPGGMRAAAPLGHVHVVPRRVTVLSPLLGDIWRLGGRGCAAWAAAAPGACPLAPWRRVAVALEWGPREKTLGLDLGEAAPSSGAWLAQLPERSLPERADFRLVLRFEAAGAEPLRVESEPFTVARVPRGEFIVSDLDASRCASAGAEPDSGAGAAEREHASELGPRPVSAPPQGRANDREHSEPRGALPAAWLLRAAVLLGAGALALGALALAARFRGELALALGADATAPPAAPAPARHQQRRPTAVLRQRAGAARPAGSS